MFVQRPVAALFITSVHLQQRGDADRDGKGGEGWPVSLTGSGRGFCPVNVPAASNVYTLTDGNITDMDMEVIKSGGDDSETQSVHISDERSACRPFAKLGDTTFAHKQTSSLSDDTESPKEPSENREDDSQEQRRLLSCKSPPQRQSLQLPPLPSRSGSVGSGRRCHVIRSGHRAEQHEEQHQKDSHQQDQEDDAAYSQMSLTEKRLAMVKSKFSSKNLFNVRRHNSACCTADPSHGRSGNPDSPKRAAPGMFFSQQRSFYGGQGRPMTSFSTFQGRQFHSNDIGRLLPRPTTTLAWKQSRQGHQQWPNMDASLGPRKPRSRQELEKLCQARIDPFGAGLQEDEGREPWTPPGDVHHDLLQALRRRGPLLQQRVTSFLKDLEDFNRRGHKTGLEQILEIK